MDDIWDDWQASTSPSGRSIDPRSRRHAGCGRANGHYFSDRRVDLMAKCARTGSIRTGRSIMHYVLRRAGDDELPLTPLEVFVDERRIPL